MLKYEGQFAVGETIRSHDFRGRRDCYVEGVVLDPKSFDLGHAAYKIRCTRRVFGGEASTEEIGVEFYAPHQCAWGEYDGRIERVGIEGFATLRRCFELIAAVSPRDANPEPEVEFAKFADYPWYKNNVLPHLATAEAELAALPLATLRHACVSEAGTVPLSYHTGEVLEALADCVFNK